MRTKDRKRGSVESIYIQVKMGNRKADCVLHVRDGKLYLWLGYLKRMLEPEAAVPLLRIWFTVPGFLHGGWAPYMMPAETTERIMQLLVAEGI